MAKERLTLYDRYGNVIEYDISAASITIDAEGKQLDVKLTELADAIAARIRSVTFNGSEKTPDQQGKISISQEQPNWNESNPQHPSYIQGKPQLANVATTGDYNDLRNLPVIPEGGPTIVPDTAMSDTSENVVQNKVIKAFVEALVTQSISNLVDGAPLALDTLKELADALGDNDDAISALASAIASKISGIKANGASTTLPVDQNGVVELPPAGSTIFPATAAPIMDGNTAAVGSSAKYAREDHVHPKDTSKQDVLTFDNAPTAGSNNPVKSGGVKTAIDQVTPTIDANGKWVIGGVVTDKDAQGPRGNTVLVNENAQGIQALIVNNVSDGGETDILSAEMGKVLRINVMKIFNALGTYAFPEGKPILTWGSTIINHNINTNGVTGGLTISDVEVDGTSVGSLPSQIADGKSLSLKLNLPVGMYVFDGVAITMGGVTITNTTGVWDESTGTIYIASVTGDISITAAAVLDPINNYAEQSHLVFQLDGLHKGPTAGKWTDLKGGNGGVVWDNHGATELDDCWQFDGSSYLDSQNMVAHEPRTCTIEVVIDSGLTNQHYFVFTDGSKMVLYYYNNYQNQDIWASRGHTNSTGYGGITTSHLTSPDNGNGKKIVSVTGNDQNTVGGKVNGVSRTATSTSYGAGPKAIIGGLWNATNNELRMPFTGKVYAIRIYDTILSEADMLANQRLDNQRFNLGLTI